MSSASPSFLLQGWPLRLLLATVACSAWTLAFPSATLLYVGAVFAHVLLGCVLLPVIWRAGRSAWRGPGVTDRALAGLLVLCALAGLYLVVRGNTHVHRTAHWLHIDSGALVVLVLMLALGNRARGWGFALAALCLLVPAGSLLYRNLRPDPDRIRNPAEGFLTMTAETGGEGPFFPSSAHTVANDWMGRGHPDPLLPERFFEDSQSCQRCHAGIYKEWESSMHHFASFNNQFYRASIEYMQSVQGSTRPSQWCAACHDSAVLFTGKWATPIKDQIHTPAAQNGLGCLSCHAVVHVKDTIGNSAFTIEDPALHDLVESKSPVLRLLHDAALYLQPTPHDATFLKSFHSGQTAEFCSACHKVHLDAPVNHYRWTRGFDEYDNWQGSGVSGQGARSFYYPLQPKDCGGCHMPLEASHDPAANNGEVHSHRFAAANTAVAFVNRDAAQLAAEEAFLKGAVSTDLFALVREAPSPPLTVPAPSARRRGATGDVVPQLQTTFAQGEESSSFGSVAALPRSSTAGEVLAPLDQVRPALHPGESVRLDVVERTLRLGHFFPGGTVDAQEAWLEVKATDGRGRVFFLSGGLLPDGSLEPSAHVYRSLLVDAHGNPINKRNAWAAHATVYVRLIPPGAADTVHYRLQVPRSIVGPVILDARLRYRKFSRAYTRFSYAGVSHPGAVSLDYDDRRMTFDGSTADVSGLIKAVPDIPIVTISAARVILPVAGEAAALPAAALVPNPLRTRWNDYGIGLLLQGDLTGAKAAFEQVTRIDPQYADGWLNVARALIQEGETAAAEPFVARSLALSPGLARALWFRALIEKAAGNYDAALTDFRATAAQFPRDRVVLDQVGRILFLERRYAEALQPLLASTAVDPENIEAHYNLMLCYRGLGDNTAARREETMYSRFKADESAQALVGAYLRSHPDDNNERQPIHEHGSERLPTMPTERAVPIRGAGRVTLAAVRPEHLRVRKPLKGKL